MSRGLWFAMSARTRRSLTLLWTALFLCSLAMQYVQLAVPAPALAAHNEGIFELDGNALDSAAAGADWQNGAEGSLDQFFVGMGSEGPDQRRHLLHDRWVQGRERHLVVEDHHEQRPRQERAAERLRGGL